MLNSIKRPTKFEKWNIKNIKAKIIRKNANIKNPINQFFFMVFLNISLDSGRASRVDIKHHAYPANRGNPIAKQIAEESNHLDSSGLFELSNARKKVPHTPVKALQIHFICWVNSLSLLSNSWSFSSCMLLIPFMRSTKAIIRLFNKSQKLWISNILIKYMKLEFNLLMYFTES